MHETQEAISQWAEKTFGPASSHARVAARANEEMAELLRALTADDNHPKAAEECADVVIVLYRLATRLREKIEIENSPLPVPAKSNFHLAAHANKHLSSLLTYLAEDDNPPSRAGFRLDDISAILNVIANRLGTNLADEIEKKMAVNYSRTWDLSGDGHGYHVRDKA